jgi:MFS family permease
LLYAFLGFTAFTIFNLTFNLYMSALGFSNALIGLMNALPAAGVLFVALPVSALADRFGSRPFLVMSSALAAIGAVGLVFLAPRLLAVLAAGTYALGITVASVMSVPMLAALSRPEERTSLYSANQSFGWIGSVVGYLLGGFVPEAYSRLSGVAAASAPSYRAGFLPMAVLQVLALALIAGLAVAGPAQAARIPLRALVAVDWLRFVRILVPQAFIGMGAGMLLTFLQLYLAQRFRLGPGAIGIVFAVAALLTAVTVLAAPALARRIGLVRTIGFTQLAGGPLVVAIALVHQLPVALGLLFVRQIVLNFQTPLGQVFGMEFVDQRERARLATVSNVVFGLGFVGLGPALSGLLQLAGGFELAFSVSAVFYLLAGLSFLLLFRGVRLPSEQARA